MENKITLPIGMSNFTEIRKNHYYYIDKTELIENLLQNNLSKGTLITRPRRFGKTLAMCMLADFLIFVWIVSRFLMGYIFPGRNNYAQNG